MHRAKQMNKKKKDKNANEKPSMTPFQEAIHEKLQAAFAQVEGFEEINDEFTDELE